MFRRFGADWRAAQAGHLDRGQRRVMGAIEACRTARLGGHVEACDDCGVLRIAYNSCRNRHTYFFQRDSLAGQRGGEAMAQIMDAEFRRKTGGFERGETHGDTTPPCKQKNLELKTSGPASKSRTARLVTAAIPSPWRKS